MAAITLAAPGTEPGPCLDEGCGHRYCRLVRRQAEEKCGICEVRIGYDRRYYGDGEFGSVHATCYEAMVEEEMEQRRRSWT